MDTQNLSVLKESLEKIIYLGRQTRNWRGDPQWYSGRIFRRTYKTKFDPCKKLFQNPKIRPKYENGLALNRKIKVKTELVLRLM